MDKIIEFMKKEFPREIMEVADCIELLNQTIDGCLASIKNACPDAIDKRNYAKMTSLIEALAEIDKIQIKLVDYTAKLQIEDECTIDENSEYLKHTDTDDKQNPNYELFKVDSNIPHSLYDVYTHKRPAGFEIFGRRFEANDWKDVYTKTCEVLVDKNKEVFESFISDKSLQGKKLQYFSKDSNVIRSPRKILGTDIFIMTNMSANQIRNNIEKLLRKYKIKITDYKIYLRADYTSIHE